MSGRIKLATTANDLKIWDLPIYEVKHHFTLPSPTPIFGLNWSYDGQALLSVPSAAENYYVTLVNEDAKCNTVKFSTDGTTTAACLPNQTNKFLGLGTRDGKILYLNQKNKQPIKTFTSHSGEITCLRFNWDDRYLTSASENGFIHLHNVTTGMKAGHMDLTKEGAVRQIKYSLTRKSVLAVATTAGTLSLWDINTTNRLHHFDLVHTAPITDLTFSPTNLHLLLSVGLDKKLKFYDVNSKSVIKSYSCEFPLTCVDMLTDGETIAVGTSQGKVLIFDNRYYKSPSKCLDAHDSAITGLSFRENLRKVRDSKRFDLLYETHNSSRESLDGTEDYAVFSPIKSNKQYLDDTKTTTFRRSSILLRGDSTNSTLEESFTNKSLQGPFTPEEKSSRQISETEGKSSLFAQKTSHLSPLYSKSSEDSTKPFSPNSPLRLSNIGNTFSSVDTNSPHHTQPPNLFTSAFGKPESFSSPMPPANLKLLQEKREELTFNGELSPAMKEYIHDELEAATEKIYKRIFNLHVQMVKGFVEQKTQMSNCYASLFAREQQHLAKIEQLEKENKRLKENTGDDKA